MFCIPNECVEVELIDHAEFMRANGIVFNEKNKYHPHWFLRTFNNYVNGATQAYGQKYLLPKFSLPVHLTYPYVSQGCCLQRSTVSEATEAIGNMNISTEHIEPSVTNNSKKFINVQLYVQYMKANGIVYNEKVKHHPHRFICLFECFIDGMTIMEGQKCLLFCLLIEMNDSFNKEHKLFIDKYDHLKNSFLAEYWSWNKQEQAFEYFKRKVIKFKNQRELATEFLKWFQTLRNAESYNELWIIKIMCQKLPSRLEAKITQEDEKDPKLFLQRLEEFAEIDKKDSAEKKQKIPAHQ